MSDALGQVDASSTINIYFTTHAQTGAAVAPLTAFEAADVKVYKDGSATERSSQSGWTMTSPFDSITGLHLLTIDLSDNTDAGFYAAGHRYVAVLTPDTETVDGLAVVRVLANWSIGPVSANMTQILGTAVATPNTAGLLDVNAKQWNALATVELPLVPTTAGRKLDVSAGGEAGLDWANVGSPTTVLDLSGTKVKTATDVETGTQDIQSRIPAALVSGRIDASVGAMAAGTVTAAAIATDAIDADAIADSAVTEIQTGLATSGSALDAAGVRAAVGLASANLDTQLDALPTNAELTTALGTADDATLAAIAGLNNLSQANVRTALGLATANLDTQLDTLPTAAEVADAVWDETLASHVGAGSTGEALDDISGVVGTGPSAGAIADAVWDEVLSGHTTVGTTGRAVGNIVSAGLIAQAVWDELIVNTRSARSLAKGWSAALMGKVSGANSNVPKFRDLDDTHDVISATTDATGNRSIVTLDLD